MKYLATLVLFQAVLQAFATNVQWSACDTGNELVTIKDIKVTDAADKSGWNIAASGTVKKEVSSGTADVSINAGGLPINLKHDLCDVLSQLGHKCPIPAGDLNLSTEVKPGLIQAGNYGIKLSASSNDKPPTPILCVNLNVTLSALS